VDFMGNSRQCDCGFYIIGFSLRESSELPEAKRRLWTERFSSRRHKPAFRSEVPAGK